MLDYYQVLNDEYASIYISEKNMRDRFYDPNTEQDDGIYDDYYDLIWIDESKWESMNIDVNNNDCNDLLFNDDELVKSISLSC